MLDKLSLMYLLGSYLIRIVHDACKLPFEIDVKGRSLCRCLKCHVLLLVQSDKLNFEYFLNRFSYKLHTELVVCLYLYQIIVLVNA